MYPQKVSIFPSNKVTAMAATGLLLTTLSLAPRAMAIPDPYTLAPGGEQNPALSSTFPTGGTTEATKTDTFSFGTVVSSVIENDSSNPYGGLTFTYLLSFTSGNAGDAVSELTVGSYGGFSTDVSYNSGSGVAPNIFSRNNVLGGNVLQFQWTGSGLPAGDVGDLIVVQTSASNYGLTSGGLLFDIAPGINLDSSLYAPSTTVPEMSGTAGLLAMALGVLFVFWRRVGDVASGVLQ